MADAPTDTDPARRRGSLGAYVLGATLCWIVALPLADWLLGDLESLGASALKGAVVGAFWGLCMYAFEGWLRRRSARNPRPEARR